jgi:hypothetical protein
MPRHGASRARAVQGEGERCATDIPRPNPKLHWSDLCPRTHLHHLIPSLPVPSLQYDDVSVRLKELSDKYQTALKDKSALLSEVASLEEQLMSKTSATPPDAAELIAALLRIGARSVARLAIGGFTAVKTVASYASNIAPGYVMELAAALHDAAEPLITATHTVFEKAAPLAGDAAKAFAEAVVAASTAALAAAIRIFTEVEAFAMKEAGKVPVLEPHVTPTTVRAATALAFGVPAAWALVKAAGAPGRIFGRRMRRVPKSVAQTSVPLRTPTPEGVRHVARTPFSPKPGGAFRSPDGDVLRFG